jgi:hypothetical protein
MTRRKISNRQDVLIYKVGVRFDEKTYNKLKEWVDKSNASTIGELVRKLVIKERVIFYTKDITMAEPTSELIKIRKELNAIGTNINQITHSFHATDLTAQKLFHAMKITEQYRTVGEKIELLWKLVTEISKQWSAK